MQPKWQAVQERFIEMCGGDMDAMQRRADERHAMEAPLIEDYLERVKDVTPE